MLDRFRRKVTLRLRRAWRLLFPRRTGAVGGNDDRSRMNARARFWNEFREGQREAESRATRRH